MESRNKRNKTRMEGNVFDYITIGKFSNEDLNTMRNVNKKYRQKVDNYLMKRTINEINRRLRQFMTQEELVEFKNAMKETNAIISGSFLLQCALQETWEGSDIDIFIPLVDNELSQTTREVYYTEIEKFLYRKKDCRYDKHYAAERYKSDIGAAIHWVKNYSVFPGKTFERIDFNPIDRETMTEEEKNKYYDARDAAKDKWRKDVEKNQSQYKLQIILVDVKKEDIYRYIKHSFDFGILKNAFYGDDKLEFMNIEQVLMKYTYYQIPGKRVGNTPTRAKKYSERGIDVRYIKDKKNKSNKNKTEEEYEKEEKEHTFEDILQVTKSKCISFYGDSSQFKEVMRLKYWYLGDEDIFSK